jgi:hypothetical protein
VNVDADVELDEVQHPGLERDVGVEVVQLEVDQVHLQLGHVQQDVWRASPIFLFEALVLPVLAVGVGLVV